MKPTDNYRLRTIDEAPPRIVKAKREDWDDQRDFDNTEDFRIWRQSRCLSDVGQEIIAQFAAEES